MINVDSNELLMWVGQLFWPLARVLALIMTAPLLSEKSIGKKVKIGLGLMITYVLIPSLPPVNVTLFSVGGFGYCCSKF